MASIEKTIFISYRRKDIAWALAVYQYLTSQKYDVFFDYTSIPSGDFEQIIVSNIRARAHFVLILTPTALDRCSQPGDWLRREIETAVDEKRNIIPLLFDGFNFASPSVVEKLTGKLASIPRYNALEIPSGYFIEAMERLSRRYLNIPLDAVIHPVSTEVRKVVQEVQVAADKALEQKKEDIEELVKPAQEKPVQPKQAQITKATPLQFGRGSRDASKIPNLRTYGIGAGILLIATLGIFGISSLIRSFGKETPVPTLTSQLIATSAITSVPPTQPLLVPANTETLIPPTSIPTLGIGSTLFSPQDGMTLVYVPAGVYTMGLTDEQTNILRQLCSAQDCEELYQVSRPAHTVELTNGFWIHRTEVSNAQYARCVASGNCTPPKSNSSGSRASYYDNPAFADYPVVWVDWDQANAYCSWAGARLPTSAEWEKAASWDEVRREKYIYPWGNVFNGTLLNFCDKNCLDPQWADLNVDDGNTDTAPVESYPGGASPYGALNMAGNVWEWVSDWFGPGYYRDNTDWINPKGPPSGTVRVGHGGSFFIRNALSSVAIQDWEEPNSVLPEKNYDGVGFRCVIQQ